MIIDEEAGYLCGILKAKGCITDYQFILSAKDKNLMEAIVEKIEKKFEITPQIKTLRKVWKDNGQYIFEENGFMITINSKIICNELKNLREKNLSEYHEEKVRQAYLKGIDDALKRRVIYDKNKN